jgi:hypothetical protein
MARNRLDRGFMGWPENLGRPMAQDGVEATFCGGPVSSRTGGGGSTRLHYLEEFNSRQRGHSFIQVVVFAVFTERQRIRLFKPGRNPGKRLLPVTSILRVRA